jgi:protein-S-isoprenylcysteine O-methyltransferase Ste14
MPAPTNSIALRTLFSLYGVISYLVFLGAILYLIGFVGGFAVPKDIDDGPVESAARSAIIDALLFLIFAAQHAIMARPWFKRTWIKLVPHAIERSTFVLVASLALLLLYWQWQPIPVTVWSVENNIGQAFLHGLFGFGWVLVFYSTFCIDHFDLFGLRQVYFLFVNKPYTHPGFAKPMIYRLVRNPLMLGFIIAFWAAPTMTQGRMLFCALATAYILFGIRLEERDLSAHLGEDYRRYRRQTPMLIPWPRRTRSAK